MTVTLEVTLPSEREIQLKRTFKTSVARLFDYHTKPELVKQWLLGPYDDSTMPVCNIDLRVGGKYRYEWHGSHHPDFGVSGTYLEVDAPHRVKFAETMDGMPGEMTCVTTFEETAPGYATITMLMDYGTKQIRDMVLESGMSDGVGASFDRLENKHLT